MRTLILRRARAQWPLLAAVLAVVTVGATLLGVCALLVTRTSDRALEVAASRAVPASTEVTAYTVTIAPRDVASVDADTRSVLREAVTPFGSVLAGRMSTVMRPVPIGSTGAQGLAYLSGVENLTDRASLVTGRWPRPGAGEAVLLERTAKALGARPGSRVRLGVELVRDPAPELTVTVVGVVRPRAGGGWERDPLEGAGYVPDYRDGSALRTAQAFGPFLMDYRELLAGGSTMSRLEITARPDLGASSPRELDRLGRGVREADRRLSAVLGERVQIERVASRLPAVLAATERQQRVTSSAVLAVAVLGAVLTAAALRLAGRLTADVRAAETALLSAAGTSRVQLTGLAIAESALLALLAVAVAAPLSSLAHAALTHLPPLDSAGLAAGPALSGPQLLAVGIGAALLFLPTPARSGLARSGADVALVALAAGAWFSARSGGADARIDVVRVLVPALLLAGGCVIALRLAPPALRAADRWAARRASGLALPLAMSEAARRPRAVAAGLLVTLGCAAATFAVAFDATWHRSQLDQANLSVGADLVLTLGAPAVAGQGAEVSRATGGQARPAVNRGVAIGQWIGGGDEPPRLVAVRGAAEAPGVPLRTGAALTVTGRATGPDRLSVTPQLVLEDASGLRTACTAPAIPLDGRPHPLPDCVPVDGMRLVAVMLPVAADEFAYDSVRTSDITVDLSVPGSAGWTAASAEPYSGQLRSPKVTTNGSSLRLTANVALGGPPDAARRLVATAFPAPGPVPATVSAALATQLSVGPGDQLDILVGLATVPVRIERVTESVAAAPGAPAIAADLDTLSRALLARGEPQFPIDAWWVTGATDASGLHLGDIRTRTGEAARLTTGPVPAALPGALRLLVPAAVLLLLAGLVLHVTCDLQARAVEVARLRGLGMTRRDIRTTLLGQHTVVLLPMLVAGTAVGAAATWLVSPLLVRAETGGVPVPAVAAVWPWPAEAALLALLLAATALAVAAVVAVQSRRADAAHLRVAS
ncbi:FtsX-like permease family protein [Actinoplanes sp. NPDC026670]|uniref:FtsX-like permease family protein n=1 Tax=Actinoplanes sp. NPDC026670 TaxID=3154700 RepID=UPI0033EE05C0